MLWGYEITDERGVIIGDEGDYAFSSKQKALLDALEYSSDLVRDNVIEKSITIKLQPIDEDSIRNSDWIR